MKWKLYILLIAGLFALTSCGSKPEEPKIEVAEIRYGVEFFDAGIVCDSFADGCAAGTDGQIYLAVSEMDEEYLPHDYLYRVSEDGLPDCILAADDFLVNGAEAWTSPPAL